MGKKRDLIVIVGTTGVGKSQFSIELARKFNGEIINADSMQMYNGAPIITNKHPIDERFDIPHHVMNHVGWDEEYFIHRFDKEAKEAIDYVYKRGKIPIVIGGTHYYLNSLIFNNKTIKSDGVDKSEKLTKEQLEILDGPSDRVLEILRERDPKVAEKFHPNDTRRIRRALEIYYTTNKRTSDHYSEQQETSGSSLKFRILPFWVYSEKTVLDKRLDDRVDKMLDQGGMDEIKELYKYFSQMEPKPDCERGVWQVIGFKEFLPWLQAGADNDKLLNQSIIDMKTRTRQYAKRQIKWIKSLLAADLAKEKDVEFVNGGQLYVLDATDLSKWDEAVNKRGSTITREFLLGSKVSLPQTPEGLELLLPKEEDKEEKSEQWEHIICEICKNPDDSQLVLVGSKQYEIHLKSKRHRSNLQRGKRKREYEEWLAKKDTSDLGTFSNQS